MDPAGITKQIAAFRGAQIIIGMLLFAFALISILFLLACISTYTLYIQKKMIGGHGAGMTNMIFAPAGSTVIEFGMEPHVDRSFGYVV